MSARRKIVPQLWSAADRDPAALLIPPSCWLSDPTHQQSSSLITTGGGGGEAMQGRLGIEHVITCYYSLFEPIRFFPGPASRCYLRQMRWTTLSPSDCCRVLHALLRSTYALTCVAGSQGNLSCVYYSVCVCVCGWNSSQEVSIVLPSLWVRRGQYHKSSPNPPNPNPPPPSSPHWPKLREEKLGKTGRHKYEWSFCILILKD